MAAGGIDVIVYACTATSLVKGMGWTQQFIQNIKTKHNLPATTAASATIDALKALGVKRVAFANPWADEINVLLRSFVEQNGLNVVGIKNMKVVDGLEVCRVSQGKVYKLAKSVDCPEAEAVAILATDLQTIDMIEPLERDLGKPVISTNQSILWKCLRLTGVKEVKKGFGSLFERA